jgi:hypothetical protein
MAASPQVVTSNPLYLNARTNIYTAHELRKQWDNGPPVAPGVCDLDSFRVRQRVAGATQTVDVTAASILNRAWVRHGSNINDGVSASTDAGLYYVDYNSASILNLDISAADPTNPRIDQIYLSIEDAQAAGANNQATVRVVTGTATGGATLDNRTGVGAAPAGMGNILLADILVPALSTSVVTANIRDRRPVALFGTLPWLGSTGTQIDAVTFQPHPALYMAAGGYAPGTHDNTQAAALMWLPRRIVGATRIRWRYVQGVTAATSNYVLFVSDVSGRVVAQTAATAFAGAVNTAQEASVALTATTTFEEGWYYVSIGLAAVTAASTVAIWGANMVIASAGASLMVRNIGLRSAAGGTTVPTTILAYTDIASLTAVTATPSIPICTLSVT